MPALVTCFGIPIDICVRKAVRCLLVFSASHTSLFTSFCFSDIGTFSPLCGRGGGGRGDHSVVALSLWTSSLPIRVLSPMGPPIRTRLLQAWQAEPHSWCLPSLLSQSWGSLASLVLSDSKGSAMMKRLQSGQQKATKCRFAYSCQTESNVLVTKICTSFNLCFPRMARLGRMGIKP